MRFQDICVYRDERCSLGKDVKNQQLYLSFPVFNGYAEYEEYYEISSEEFERYATHSGERQQFAEACRKHQMDNRLIIKPGPDDVRGSPC